MVKPADGEGKLRRRTQKKGGGPPGPPSAFRAIPGAVNAATGRFRGLVLNSVNTVTYFRYAETVTR
jgi:hypothetical protein